MWRGHSCPRKASICKAAGRKVVLVQSFLRCTPPESISAGQPGVVHRTVIEVLRDRILWIADLDLLDFSVLIEARGQARVDALAFLKAIFFVLNVLFRGRDRTVPTARRKQVRG